MQNAFIGEPCKNPRMSVQIMLEITHKAYLYSSYHTYLLTDEFLIDNIYGNFMEKHVQSKLFIRSPIVL